MEVDPILLTVLGVAAGVLILTGWVDQIYKGYKSKSLKDVSSFLMIFISAGAILWLIYGIIVIDVFIIGTNIAAIVLMLIVLTMKRKYDKKIQVKWFNEELNTICKIQKNMFIINCKNYEEISGDKIIKFVKTAEKISKKFKIKIAICPPQHLIGVVSNSSIPILAQHVDDSKIGSTTGFVIPELLKKSKVKGSLINHSEHRISSNEIKKLVEKLKELKMISVVCVKDVAEARKYAKLNPNYIAIEPPELIGSGKAVSTEKPELISKAVIAVKSAKNNTKLLCGAGIVSGDDVAKASELGSKGILVASGIIKAQSWEKIISDFAKALV